MTDGRHLHHQRRRARRRLAARPLARRLLRARCRTRPVRALATAKLIPNRGAWLEFETSNRDVLSVKVDRKRKMPVTILLRADRRGRDRRERAAGAVRRRRHQPGPPTIMPGHARQGADQDQGRGADGALPPAAPGRPADAGQRRSLLRLAVLQLAPLRPRQGRPLQAERAPAPRGREGDRAHDQRDPDPGRPDRDHPRDDPAQQRPRRRGRHRPPGQPPRPRGGRADPDARPHRPASAWSAASRSA